jgi:hypothetical protein
MFRYRTPANPSRLAERAAALQVSRSELSAAPSNVTTLLSGTLTLTPTLTLNTNPFGQYYSVGNQTLAVNGKPLQPKADANATQTNLSLKGVVIETASYATTIGFDPVIAAVVTSTYSGSAFEPAYSSPNWYPASLATFNHLLTTTQGITVAQDTVVAIFGQYRNGAQRRYQQMLVRAYYSDASDVVPPVIRGVAASTLSGVVTFIANATDGQSGVQRVVITYTDGKGAWQSVDLAYNSSLGVWYKTVTLPAGVDYFVQAVDGAGNVSVSDGRGAYFTINGGAQVYTAVYLPLVVR